jgi:hypothetical protein
MPIIINPSDQTIIQYSVQTGGPNNLLNSVNPGTATQVLTSNGPGAQPSFQTLVVGEAFDQIVVQTFTTSGTYTPTVGMKYCLIELVGGGGGGGGTTTCGATQASVGGGGGSGGYSRTLASSATIGASQIVTCGAGGTAGNTSGGPGGSTSVGTICVAGGGSGGAGSGAATSAFFAVGGGQGGTGTTGDVLVNGNPGATGEGSSVTSFVTSGLGGASFFGGGAYNVSGTAAAPGNPGTKGGGGSGAVTGNNTTAQLGGVGGVGYVVITEYLSVNVLSAGPSVSSIGTQTGTNPILPTLGGLVTINGAVAAAGTHPVRSDGTGANTMALEVQTSQAIAAPDATKIGLSNFSSSFFAVDSTGFVTPSPAASFLVYLTTDVLNVTGDGTAYSLLFDTIGFDVGSNITLNSGGHTIFTAPVTGMYQFNMITNFIWAFTAAAGTDSMVTQLQRPASNNTRYGESFIPHPGFSNAQTGSVILSLAAGEILSLVVIINATSGKTANFRGTAGGITANCWSGQLLS